MNTEQHESPASAAQEVEIPATAVVHCPLVDFKLRQVAKCMDCPKFGGALQDRFPGAAHLSFTQRYAVPCFDKPVSRQMTELE